MKRLICFATFAAAALSATTAQGAVFYDISYVGDPTRAVDGAVLSARVEVETYAGGINGVLSLTGTRNGLPIRLLEWMEFPEPGEINQEGNDNLLKDLSPFFTTYGIGFTDGVMRYKMFTFDRGLMMECRGSGPRCTNAIIVRDVSVRAVVPDVPEPATWALMLAGFGLVGSRLRSRRRVSVTYA